MILFLNRSVVIGFKLVSIKEIKNKNNKCIEDENYSLTKCLKDFVAKTVGCSLQWFQQDDHPVCSEKEEMIKTQELYDLLQRAPLPDLSIKSGCLQKCTTINHDISILSEENTVWEKKWMSEVFIKPNGAFEEENIEYLVYDVADMIGNLGGYLGLFLGWSLLSLSLYVPQVTRKIWHRMMEKIEN